MNFNQLFSGTPARLRVLKNGESDHSRAVTVVGPDLTNVSGFNNFNNCNMVITCDKRQIIIFCGGGGFGQLPKIFPVQKKTAEKIKLCKESHGEKIE